VACNNYCPSSLLVVAWSSWLKCLLGVNRSWCTGPTSLHPAEGGVAPNSKACSACPSGGYSLVAPMMWKAAKSCASVDVPTAGMVQPHCKALQSAYEVWPVGSPEATSTASVLGEVPEKLVAVRATLCTFPQDVSASGLVFAPKAKPSIPKAIPGYRYEKSSRTKSRSTRKGRGYYAPSFFS